MDQQDEPRTPFANECTSPATEEQNTTPPKETGESVLPATSDPVVEPVVSSRPRRSTRPPLRYQPETGTWS